MIQYRKIKDKYPDAVLLFHVGDFYETFDVDALTTSSVLSIVLTKKADKDGKNKKAVLSWSDKDLVKAFSYLKENGEILNSNQYVRILEGVGIH